MHTPGTRIVQTCCRRKSRIAYSSQCSYGALSHFYFWHLQIQRWNCTRQTRNWFPERLQACFQQGNVRCCHFPHGAQGVHHGTIHANVMFLWSLPQSYLGFHKLETAAKGTTLAASAKKLEMLSSVFLFLYEKKSKCLNVLQGVKFIHNSFTPVLQSLRQVLWMCFRQRSANPTKCLWPRVHNVFQECHGAVSCSKCILSHLGTALQH